MAYRCPQALGVSVSLDFPTLFVLGPHSWVYYSLTSSSVVPQSLLTGVALALTPGGLRLSLAKMALSHIAGIYNLPERPLGNTKEGPENAHSL